MPCDPIGVAEFSAELVALLSGERATIEHTFDDVTVRGTGRGTTWRLDGVVKGAHRRARMADPDAPMGLALAADLAVVVERGRGERARAALSSGAAGLHLEVDHPELFWAALPRELDVARVLRGLADADVRAAVSGPLGRLAVLDPQRPSRLAALLTGNAALRPTPRGVAVWLHRPGRRGAVLAGLAGVVLAGVPAAVRGRRRRSR